MPNNISTNLNVALNRIMQYSIDAIAKQGIIDLKSVLDSSGFGSSPYLKNYEISSHVTRGAIIFEIILDMDSILPEDSTAEKDIKNQINEQNKLNKIKEVASRKYGLFERSVKKTYNDSRKNAKRPAKDARRPTTSILHGVHSVFYDAEDRLIEHEIALHLPRSMNLTKDGKISISFRRSIREMKSSNFVYPKGKFEGIPKEFLKKLEKTILSQFAPKLSAIIESRF